MPANIKEDTSTSGQTTPADSIGAANIPPASPPPPLTQPTWKDTPSQEVPPGPQAPPAFQGPPPSKPKIISAKETPLKFPIIIGFLIVLALAVYGFVAYLYFGNQKLKEEIEDKGSSQAQPVAELPTPIPTQVPDRFEIENGNINRISSSAETTVVVNKEDYQDTGIIGFTNVNLSPDNDSICFWSLPPALGPALYYADTDGVLVTKVADKAKGCVWSNSSEKLAYVNDSAQGSATDIFVYDLVDELETNLTEVATTSAVYRRYEINTWSADDTAINCNYEEIDPADTSLEVVGNCQIDVVTAEVTDL